MISSISDKEDNMKEHYITCADCGQEFTVSEEEAKWYKDKGFEMPKRCPDCRKKRRHARNTGGKKSKK